jgi:hypothetical protein
MDDDAPPIAGLRRTARALRGLCAPARVPQIEVRPFLSTSQILVSVAALTFEGWALLRVLVKHALAGAFDSDEVKILTDAFDQAWKAVEESGVCFASGTYKNATREILALRIIEIAGANATPIAFAMMPFCISPERTSRALA